MVRTYFRSLDRPLNIFGLRGGWIRNFGVFSGAGLVLAIIVGVFTSSGIGMGVFIGGIAVSFFACLVLQAKVPYRRLPKAPLQEKMRLRVIRRRSLCRNVAVDARRQDESLFDFLVAPQAASRGNADSL